MARTGNDLAMVGLVAPQLSTGTAKLLTLARLLIVTTLVFSSIVVLARAEESDFIKCFKSLDQEAKQAESAMDQGDFADALRIYREAADRGNRFASLGLCIFHLSGRIPEALRDYAEAFKICQRQALNDNSVAQHILGRIYLGGLGVSQNETEAMYWFRQAASQGDKESQYVLGLAHVTAKGVPRDFVSAYMWLNLAAAAGQKDARQTLDTVSRLLTRAEITDAQRLTRQWKPTESKGRWDPEEVMRACAR